VRRTSRRLRDGAHLLLHSDRRVDADDARVADPGADPKSDLIPKLVTGLLAHRKAGRWLNTQENAFALLALDRYFRTYEKTTPDFVAQGLARRRLRRRARVQGPLRPTTSQIPTCR
jgi:hypothetical protein